MFIILRSMLSGAEQSQIRWDMRTYRGVHCVPTKIDGRWVWVYDGDTEDYRLAEMYCQMNLRQVGLRVCPFCARKGDTVCGHLVFERMVSIPKARRILVQVEDGQWDDIAIGEGIEIPTIQEVFEIPAWWEDNQIGAYLDWCRYGM